jgi:hypothetical protein
MMCESGWTGDRCMLQLGHAGPHDNEDGPARRCPMYGCVEFHPGGHDEIDGECARCGEWTTDVDRAEVGAGLVHASCMLDGEVIA